MAFDYVKFRRGNADAFSALRPKDPNTLYFIYTSVEAKKGLLYLGDKLIGGGEFSSLIDVDVADAQPGDILIYANNGTDENPEWVWKSIDPERLPLIPEDAVLPEDSHLAPGDTLSQAIMKLDEAIGLSDSNTWRAVHVNGVEALSNAITSGAVNFAAGEGLVLSAENGTITIAFSSDFEDLIKQIVDEYFSELPIFSEDGPGLVPSTEDIQPADPDDPDFDPSEYVLTADGTWIHITNISGPYWEDLTGIIIKNYGGVLLTVAVQELADILEIEPASILTIHEGDTTQGTNRVIRLSIEPGYYERNAIESSLPIIVYYSTVPSTNPAPIDG